jgi:L-fucose isomerase-like protein
MALRYAVEPDTDDTEAVRVLYFLTGGSEREALKYLDDSVFQLLIADSNSNAFASAMEVMAYGRQHGHNMRLLCLDDESDVESLRQYLKTFPALKRLKGKRIGLVGEASEWLVSSTISSELLKQRLGIELIEIPWSEAGNFRDYSAEKEFLSCYHAGRQFNIDDAGKVETLLHELVKGYKLDALTVECFSLVQQNKVTACLGLSFLNDLGIPSGCEGDLCSITGMIIARELIGQIPWMANVAGIKGNEVLLAHCTAPTNLLSEFHVNTHFETGEGTAVHGRFKEREVSIFRINSALNRLFYAQAKVVDGMYNKHACRTQLHVVLSDDTINELKTDPLGNHHLIIPGNWIKELKTLASIIEQS